MMFPESECQKPDFANELRQFAVSLCHLQSGLQAYEPSLPLLLRGYREIVTSLLSAPRARSKVKRLL